MIFKNIISEVWRDGHIYMFSRIFYYAKDIDFGHCWFISPIILCVELSCTKISYLKCKLFAIFWNIWVSINFLVIFIEKGPDLKFKNFHEKYRYALYFFCFIFFLYMAFGCSKGILVAEYFENSNFPICEWECHYNRE